jgi:aldehyde dehydrogenase (NAD+)
MSASADWLHHAPKRARSRRADPSKETDVPEIAQYQNLIGGQLKDAASGRTLDSLNPATGEVWATIPHSDSSDAIEAVAAAKAAFPAWSVLSPDERTVYLKRVADLFVEHGAELGRLESQDNGTPTAICSYVNSELMKILWDRKAHDTLAASTGRSVPLDATTLGLTIREPLGVIAAIVPYNMPIAMMSNKAAGALAAGNTVVVKPPEQACAAMLRFGELVNEILPAGTLNFVSGLGDVGDAMVRHVDVAKVTMTGSTATARLIQAAGAETLTPAIFELGGKSPNIVLDDADLDAAAMGLTVASIFGFNAGQACVAGSRILVQRSVYDEVVERVEAIAQGIVLGDPNDPGTSMGPLISQQQRDKVVAFIESGLEETELLFGGRHGPELVPDLPGGYWVEPTLFLAKDNAPRICREEVFGPVGVVIPFDTDDEAIALANDSRYGLASGLWSRDLTRIHRYLREIQSGNVWVNTYLQARHEIPFGGIKESGYGYDDTLEFTKEKGAVIALPWAAATGGTATVFSQLD